MKIKTTIKSGYWKTWKLNTVEKPIGLKKHVVWDDRLAEAITA